jgi:signal transduction histidine kinase
MYVLILALILLVFSALIYLDFRRDFNDAQQQGKVSDELHNETLSSVFDEILITDVLLLLVTAAMSYALAGYTLRPIQRSVEVQRIFSENASHELRTPLAILRNDAEVLLHNAHPSKEQVRTTLLSAIEEIDRMTRMTNDLLVIARSEHHGITLTDTIDLSELSQHILSKLQGLAHERGVTLAFEGTSPVFVKGDRAGLERVVMNLLQNAIQYTPAAGMVTSRVTTHKAHAVIEIRDTGSGIEERDIPHLFERFYKGQGTSGTGLGLAIVKEIVEQHKGSIVISSKKGEGTQVVLTFPAYTNSQ